MTDVIDLTKLAETDTTLTLGWSPVPCTGYRFSAEKQTKPSHTWDAARSSVRFAKGSAWYRVEALGVAAVGEYLPSPQPVPPGGDLVWNADLATGDRSQYGDWEFGGTFDGVPSISQRVIVAPTIDGYSSPIGTSVMKVITAPGDSYGASTGWRTVCRMPPESTNGGQIVQRPHGYDSSWTWLVLVPSGWPFGASVWQSGPEFHSSQYVPVAPYHFIIYANEMRVDVAGNKGQGNSNRVVYVDERFLTGYEKNRWYVFSERYRHGVYPNGHYELWAGKVGGGRQMTKLIDGPGIGSAYKEDDGTLIPNYMMLGNYRAQSGTEPMHLYYGGFREYASLASAKSWAEQILAAA